MGFGQKKYLVLTQEELTNRVEERALQIKTIKRLCKFPLEDIIYNCSFIEKIIVDN